jgi:photosystem II stability/assembly factor-like uncharacterized protein
VQQSVDGGKNWATQYTVEGAQTLTAGATPGPTVCWLVGQAGSILLTTDGRIWQRVKFPEPVTLTQVMATDARNATVTAIDGRSFTTTDGGVTWQRK